MDPHLGLIILIMYPIILVGALFLFAKHSKKPE